MWRHVTPSIRILFVSQPRLYFLFLFSDPWFIYKLHIKLVFVQNNKVLFGQSGIDRKFKLPKQSLKQVVALPHTT